MTHRESIPLAFGFVAALALTGPAVDMLSATSDPAPGSRTAKQDQPGTLNTVEWRFSEPQPDWRVALPPPGLEAARLERTADALRVTLTDSRTPSELTYATPAGGVYVDLPDWRRGEWAEVVIRVRSTNGVSSMSLGLNPREGTLPAGAMQATFQVRGGITPIVRDGLVHTYRIHADWGSQRAGPWRRIGLWFQSVRAKAPTTASIDVLSVRVEPTAIARPQGRIIETMLTVPQLKSDFALARLAIEEAHADLYRFTTKQAMDAEFARAEAKLTLPMTVLQFHNVLAPVLGAIKSGDGIRKYQGGEISALVASSKLFPLALTFESDRAVVVLNRGPDARVRPGMEVLAINGQSLAQILRRILPNLPQSGDVRTGQMYELGMSEFVRPWITGGTAKFGEAYRLYLGAPARFRTTLRDPQTERTVDVDLAGVTNAEVAVNVEQNPVNRDVLAGIRTLRDLGPRRSIRYLDSEDAAVLLVSAFGGNFPDFLKETFEGLRSKGTRNLIVDLRGCIGGSAQYVGLLFTYLASREFRQFEQSYAKTIAPSFRQYTSLGEVDPVMDPIWGSAGGRMVPDPNGGWRRREGTGSTEVQKPAEPHFDGPVYILIDGGTISAGSVFSAIADFDKRATFIGEETYGTAQGGSGFGGEFDISPTLPASHLTVDIAGSAFFIVADPNNRRRGTLPKHAVRQTFDDLVKGRDTVLEFTRELIRSGKWN